MTLILDGKKVRDEIAAELTRQISSSSKKPTLAIVQVGDLEESNRYIQQKKLFGEKVGAEVILKKFDVMITEEALLSEITKLNKDSSVHGVLVQLPLSAHLNQYTVIEAIDPRKDVDGLTAQNLKLLWECKKEGYVPATVKGVLALLDYYHIELSGKKVVVVGRSTLVGKPMALALLNRDATVTVCHRKTKDLARETKQADVIIAAAGHINLITKDHVSSGQVVVDVGINLVTGEHLDEEVGKRKLVGDVDFEQVKDIVAAISPVPGGVGPMTVVSLFENLLQAYYSQGGR